VHHKQRFAQSQIRIEFGLLRHRLKFALDDLLQIIQGIGEAVPLLVSQGCDVQAADLFRYRGYGIAGVLGHRQSAAGHCLFLKIEGHFPYLCDGLRITVAGTALTPPARQG
jgi:hypothetical protein